MKYKEEWIGLIETIAEEKGLSGGKVDRTVPRKPRAVSQTGPTITR